MSEKLPSLIYIRAGTAADSSLFLVESALFTIAGSLPDGCTLPRMIRNGSGGGDDPGVDDYRAASSAWMGEHDGRPVFGLPIPPHVFAEMLHGMRFMDLLPDMYRHVPPSLKKRGMKLAAWRHYLQYYGLALEADEPEDHVSKEERKHAKKRAKLEQMPRGAFLKRVCVALAAAIKGCPNWPRFVAGALPILRCDLVSSYLNRPAGEPSSSFTLQLKGKPLVSGSVHVAFELGCASGDDGMKPQKQEAISAWLLEALGYAGTHVATFHTIRNHTEGKRDGVVDTVYCWPASTDGQAIRLTMGYHDIVTLKIVPIVN